MLEADVEAVGEGRLDGVGLTWVRTRALWRAIEPADTRPRTRDWTMSDAVVTAAHQRGLRIVLNLYDHPAWAATTRCGPVDLVPLSRFGEFVGDVVERYDGDGTADAPGSPVVARYEILNEPDFDRAVRLAHPEFGDPVDGYGGCFGQDPTAYAELLRVAHGAVKAADAGAEVVFGAVAYDRFFDDTTFSPQGPFRARFVRDVLTALRERHGDEAGFPFFDRMAFHNYNDFRDNWDGADGTAPEIVGKAAHLRAEQLRRAGVYDLSHMPLISTEVGLAADPSDPWTVRSERYQAAYVGQVFARTLAASLDLAVWYTTEDYAAGDCGDPYAWLTNGLLRSTWVAGRAARCAENPLPGYAPMGAHEPKPAHTAVGVATGFLRGAAYDRRLTIAETGSSAIEAHRVRAPDGHYVIVAFTDTGERLGKRGVEDLTASMTVGASLLPDSTARLKVTDHVGAARTLAAPATIVLSLAPTYVEAAR